MAIIGKKLFKHGGSYAVDLPKEFVKSRGMEVIIKYDKDRLIVVSKSTLENIESEPEFKTFIKALVEDSLKSMWISYTIACPKKNLFIMKQ